MRHYNEILLALHGIGYMAAQIEHVRTQLALGEPANAIANDIRKQAMFEHADVLSETTDRLKAIMEDLGGYMSNCDMVSDETVAVTTPLFELLND